MDATAIEARLRAFFEENRRGATSAYLFGSVARGEARPDSDVDVHELRTLARPERISDDLRDFAAAIRKRL